jgi:hypothetical protein
MPEHFQTPCWQCRHFDGWTAGGVHSLCAEPRACRVVADPPRGCVFFVREPFTDDGMPAGYTGWASEGRRQGG